jgi:glycosyltransferase involved in cell wall biosynthesis
MPRVEIAATEVPLRNELLLGRALDRPTSGSTVDPDAMEVEGWAIGRHRPVVMAEVTSRGVTVLRVPVDKPRPEVAAAFPGIPAGRRCGFRGIVTLNDALPHVGLAVMAVLAGGVRVPLGIVQARRVWPESAARRRSPVVSVVIPCYNQAHLLGEAIESLRVQTYPHFEVIVVDDGSSDNTQEVAARYPGIRCVRQRNRGSAAARNRGLQLTAGGFVVFLDADDRLLPDALDIGLEQLEKHPESALAVGRSELINLHGERMQGPPHRRIDRDHYLRLFSDNYFGAPANGFYRRSVFSAVGLFDPTVEGAEDYDMYLRITRGHPVVFHGRAVSQYRLHARNKSKDPVLMLRVSKTVLGRQRRHAATMPGGQDAYKEGKAFWNSFYGTPLIDEVGRSLQERAWPRALRGTRTLLRYHPAGLVALPGRGILGRRRRVAG